MQAVSEDPAIEVASVRWERVQLIVEARTISGPPDTTRLRLVADVGGEPMAPTRATVDGNGLTIRFNLDGPGLQPLAPGRWTLILGRAVPAR